MIKSFSFFVCLQVCVESSSPVRYDNCCSGFFPLFGRGRQLTAWPSNSSMLQRKNAVKCGLTMRSEICPQCVLGAFTPMFSAVRLCSVHSGCMLIPGLNRFTVMSCPPHPLSVSFSWQSKRLFFFIFHLSPFPLPSLPPRLLRHQMTAHSHLPVVVKEPQQRCEVRVFFHPALIPLMSFRVPFFFLLSQNFLIFRLW